MPTLYIYRGLPASGKTTAARAWVAGDPSSNARVNRDDLREMAHAGVWRGQATEKQIVAMRNASIGTLLRTGYSVACDDTNLPQATCKDLAQLARNNGADWVVIDLTNVGLTTCIARDAARAKPVGEDIIRSMHAKFLASHKGKPLPPVELPEIAPAAFTAPYAHTAGLPACIIVDVDGTVALADGRGPYEEDRVHEDLPNLPVISVVLAVGRGLINNADRVVFMSGRSDGCREATEVWLKSHVCVPVSSNTLWRTASLHMRAAGDSRKDTIVKRELFEQHIRGKFNVLAVFDDRNSVVKMWRGLGLTCFQVAEGDF